MAWLSSFTTGICNALKCCLGRKVIGFALAHHFSNVCCKHYAQSQLYNICSILFCITSAFKRVVAVTNIKYNLGRFHLKRGLYDTIIVTLVFTIVDFNCCPVIIANIVYSYVGNHISPLVSLMDQHCYRVLRNRIYVTFITMLYIKLRQWQYSGSKVLITIFKNGRKTKWFYGLWTILLKQGKLLFFGVPLSFSVFFFYTFFPVDP